MAPIVAAAALLYQGYEGIADNQKSQDAKGAASATLATQAAAPANEASAESKAASATATRQKAAAKAATGQSSTILTGPLGAPQAPTQKKTLLGE